MPNEKQRRRRRSKLLSLERRSLSSITSAEYSSGSDQMPSFGEESGFVETAYPVPSCKNECRGEASVFCKDCMAFYCQACFASHQLVDSLENHSSKCLENVPLNVCVEHEKDFESVCNTCTCGASVRLICETCVQVEHKDHDIEDIANSVQVAIEEYERLIESANSYLTKTETLSEKLAGTLAEVDNNEIIAKKDIEETFRKLYSVLEIHKKKLESCVTDHFNTVRTKMTVMKAETEMNRARCKSLKLQMETLVQSDNPLHLLRLMPPLRENVKKLTNKHQPNVGFKLVRTQTQTSLNQLQDLGELGKIELIEPVVTLEGQFQLKYAGQKVVSGMAVVRDHLCVTHIQDPNLWCYDLSASSFSLRASKVPNLHDPRGMGLLRPDEGTFVISDQHPEGGKLHFIKLKPCLDIDYIQCVETNTTQPRKITICRETREVLVGQSDSSEFLVFNEQGTLLKSVNMPSGKSPICAIRVPRGFAILACDKLRNCEVECLDRNEKPQKMYQAANTERFRGAHHMVHDDKGRIIMADFGNDKIVLLEASGKRKVILHNASDNIHGPQCLLFDKASRLYLVHGKPGAMEVRIYQWFGDRESSSFQVALTLPNK